MVTCQSSELGWEVTVELPTDFLSLGRGSVMWYSKLGLMAHIEPSVKYRINKERKIKEKMGMRQVAR